MKLVLLNIESSSTIYQKRGLIYKIGKPIFEAALKKKQKLADKGIHKIINQANIFDGLFVRFFIMASQNDTTCSMAIIPTTKISTTNRMLQNKSMAMLPRDSQIKPLKFEYNESDKSVHETRLIKNSRRLIG